jgi:hypothetical protein
MPDDGSAVKPAHPTNTLAGCNIILNFLAKKIFRRID